MGPRLVCCYPWCCCVWSSRYVCTRGGEIRICYSWSSMLGYRVFLVHLCGRLGVAGGQVGWCGRGGLRSKSAGGLCLVCSHPGCHFVLSSWQFISWGGEVTIWWLWSSMLRLRMSLGPSNRLGVVPVWRPLVIRSSWPESETKKLCQL